MFNLQRSTKVVYLVLFSLFILLASDLFAQQAMITKVKGRVRVLIGERSIRAKVGLKLTGRETIKTGRRAKCEVIFEQGQRLIIRANTTMELQSLKKESSTMKLIKGRIRAIIKKLLVAKKSRKAMRFRVRTPVGVCAVRGTDFSAEYENEIMRVEVYEGVVSAKEEITGSEVLVNPGEYSVIEANKEPSAPDLIEAEEPIPEEGTREQTRLEAQREIFNEISREQVMARVADEIRAADYYEGKTAIDASGMRVRMESYIVRDVSSLLDTQFKYVNINERENRFDFGKILFTFNKSLDKLDNLEIATKDMIISDSVSKPDYILTEMESVMSNTDDKITEKAWGGDMVGISGDWMHTFDNFQFCIGNKDSTENEGRGLIRWEVAGNYVYYYNYPDGVTQTLQGAPGQPEEYPSGTDKLHIRNKDVYADGFSLTLDKYVLDNDGNLLTSDLAEVTEDVNYEYVYASDSFSDEHDNKIDLVTSGKIYKWLNW